MQTSQRQKGGVKYVRIVQVISQTPCKQPLKRCAWCCYHGGYATTLSRHTNICVRRHIRRYFSVDMRFASSRVLTLVCCARAAAQAQAQAAYFSSCCIRAQGSFERNLLATFARTHSIGDSASLVGGEKGKIASHQPSDLSNWA